MQSFSNSADRLMSISLALGQYPILCGRIRSRMRDELYKRGVVDKQEFEAQVRKQAIQSQDREGLRNPVGEEPTEIWEERHTRVRDQLTDLTFSQHLSFDLFQNLVTEILNERGVERTDPNLAFNPEQAPQELIFEHAWSILRLPPQERTKYEHHLEESLVVLIRTMISDQLPYVNIAKRWFTIPDLAEIRKHKIGAGRIGGKAAGMLLAYRILNNELPEELQSSLNKPEYYFIGSNEMYSFLAMNDLERWNDQKYKNEDEMRSDYPKILREFLTGKFPSDIRDKLESLLQDIGKKPLIVRSSSLLEDSFGTSFAGKYESIFVPNQVTEKENLKALLNAIARVYASTINPDALLYRRSKGLQDYDERMAILIMVVEGEQFKHYYLPDAAGVAFSRNLYRWAPQIRREDGFVRLVWGLGTRAVDRVGNDYPRLVALSHPLLRPTPDQRTMERCSQKFVDVINLDENAFMTLPVHDVLDADYPALRYIAQVSDEGYFSSLRSRLMEKDREKLVLTFEDLLRGSDFANRLRQILTTLERCYQHPVDVEFTLNIQKGTESKPDMCFTLLQCRPQSRLAEGKEVEIPGHLPESDVILQSRFMVPQGVIEDIDTVVFVPPIEYFNLQMAERFELARVISKLNGALKGNRFIFVGPGRWGSTNADLGIPVGYSDIFNTRALVELSGKSIGPAPEPSLGTHFFQDLLEAQIYPLAIMLDDPLSILQPSFFYHAPNSLGDLIPADETAKERLRVIRISSFRKDHTLRLVMDEEHSMAVGYLTPKISKN
ncbi:MAG: PEP/pyruvate-binding domain-containing protein [Anaerolineaceae bacterium]|nr:PEP/pyruvate-binding domain-containing protein [Anaerolineaceae bacterium]